MTSNEMRQAAAKLIAEARTFMDEIDGDEKRSWIPEDEAQYQKMLDDSLDLKKRADRQDAHAKLEADNQRAVNDVPPVDVQKRTDGSEAEQRAELEAALDEAFADVMFYRSGNGPTQQAQSTYEARALQADIDTTGGYTVAPAQFVTRLIQAVDNLTFFPSLATVIDVTSSDKIEGVSLDTDPGGARLDGLRIRSASEDSSMAFGGRGLEPHQLTKLIKVARKLLRVSALPVQAIILERLSYVLAITYEATYMTGHGAGQPLGVFTASNDGITTTQDISTGNTNTAFTFDGLKEAKYDLKAQYWPTSNWIFHRDAVKMASKLKDGEGQYQWQSSIVGGDPDRLMGFPVRISEYAPNTFTSGLYVGILGDFSKYWIARLAELEMQRLDELYAVTGQVGFVNRSWSDGMPVLAEAFRRVTLT